MDKLAEEVLYEDGSETQIILIADCIWNLGLQNMRHDWSADILQSTRGAVLRLLTAPRIHALHEY